MQQDLEIKNQRAMDEISLPAMFAAFCLVVAMIVGGCVMLAVSMESQRQAYIKDPVHNKAPWKVSNVDPKIIQENSVTAPGSSWSGTNR